MKKFLKIISAAMLLVSSSSGAVGFVHLNNPSLVTNLDPSDDLENELVSLEEVLVNTDLGYLQIKEDNSEDIWNLIAYKNPDLFIDELMLTDIDESSALVSVKEDSVHYYQEDSVWVSFELVEKQLLNTVINRHLFMIKDNDVASILEGFTTFNPAFDTSQIEVVSESITKTSAVIQAKLDSFYQGEVLLTYTLALKSLVTNFRVLPNRNLGFIQNNDEPTLIKNLLAKNPELEMDELEIFNIKKNMFYLAAKMDSVVYKQNEFVRITFRMPELSLKSYFNNSFDLGPINSNELALIEESLTNLGIKIDEVNIFNITNSSFQLQAIETSKLYRLEEPLTISFNLPVKADLSTTVGQFSWIIQEGQTNDDILEKIQQKVVAKTGYDAVLGIDYDVVGLGEEANENLLIKAKASSYFLVGETSFALLDKISLSEFTNLDYPKPWPAVQNPVEAILPAITSYFEQHHIEMDQEDNLDKVLNSNITVIDKTLYNPVRDSFKDYYDTVTFEVFQTNPYFVEASQAKLRFQAPDYNSYDNFDFLNLDKTQFSTVIDSSGDSSYKYQNEYSNIRINGARGSIWHNSKSSLVLAKIDVQKTFNFKDIDAFLAKYSVNLNYKYMINQWANDGSRWKYRGKNGGKDMVYEEWNADSFLVTNNTLTDRKFENNLSETELPASSFQQTDKHIVAGYTLQGGLHIWIEKSADNKILEIKAESAVYFQTHSKIDLAVYVYFGAESIQLLKK